MVKMVELGALATGLSALGFRTWSTTVGMGPQVTRRLIVFSGLAFGAVLGRSTPQLHAHGSGRHIMSVAEADRCHGGKVALYPDDVPVFKSVRISLLIFSRQL